MRLKIIITPMAEANLREIHRHIARDNPGAARRFVTNLRKKIGMLAENPLRCPPAREDGLDGMVLRQLLYGGYRIIFMPNRGM